MIDLAAVQARMIELENAIADDPRPEVPLYDVLATMAGIDPQAPGLVKVVASESARAQTLASDHYAVLMGRMRDDPEAAAITGFLQGVTFARAVADVGGALTLSPEEARALRAHLKGHTVADVTAQLESLGVIQAKLDRAES